MGELTAAHVDTPSMYFSQICERTHGMQNL